MKYLLLISAFRCRLDQFHIQGLTDPKTIASNLSLLHVLMMPRIGFIVLKKDKFYSNLRSKSYRVLRLFSL